MFNERGASSVCGFATVSGRFLRWGCLGRAASFTCVAIEPQEDSWRANRARCLDTRRKREMAAALF